MLAGTAYSAQFWQISQPKIGHATYHCPSMPYFLGFHVMHFWNPWRMLINPWYVLFMGPEILLKTASAYCHYQSYILFATTANFSPSLKWKSIAGSAFLLVPVVTWNHSIFDKGTIAPLDS